MDLTKNREKYLIPLIGVWNSFDGITFDLLSEKFILKANHRCPYNIIIEIRGY